MKLICNNLAMMLYLVVFAALGTASKALTPYDELDEEEKDNVLSSPLAFLNVQLQSFLDDKRRSDEDKITAKKVKDKLNSSRALATIFPYEAGSDTRAGLTYEDEDIAQRFIEDAYERPSTISKERLAHYQAYGRTARRASIAVHEGEAVAMRMVPIVPPEVDADINPDANPGENTDPSAGDEDNTGENNE